MDETEFQKNIERARAHLLGLSNNLENNRNQLNQEVAQRATHESKDKRDTNSYLTENAPAQAFDQPVANKLSKLDLEKKGATDVLEGDHLSQYFYEYPFLYAHAGDLTVDDVESLLNSYKQLVVKYVSLSKGIGIGSSALIPSITQVHMRTETSKKSQDAVGMKVKNENYEEFMTEAALNSNFSGRLDDKESKMPTGDSVDNSSGEKGDVSNLH